MAEKTLSELTNGAIDYRSFADFVDDRGEAKAKRAVERYLGFEIPNDGVEQPLFNNKGEPLRWGAGTPMSLRWRWVAAFVEKLIRDHAPDAVLTENISDLPIPFWQPVDFILFTKDGDLITSMRSNHTGNGIGRVFTLAAGYIKAGETNEDCRRRELREETGLEWNGIVKRTVTLPTITNRPIQRYEEKLGEGEEKTTCCCPNVVGTIAGQADLSTDEVIARIRSNEESAGILVIPASDLANIEKDATVEAIFYPSSGLEKLQPSMQNLVRNSGELSELRNRLVQLREQNPSVRIPKGSYTLEAPVRISVTAVDFLPRDDAKQNEILAKTVFAAQKLKITPSEPKVLSKDFRFDI